MNLITIKKGTKQWKFQITQRKFMICTKNEDYELIQAIRLFSSKEKSEYRSENNIQSTIFLDEQELKTKNNLFLEISNTYSLNEEKKLTTKTLMLKYLELKLQSNELFDTISTLDLLFESLAEEVNEDSILKIFFNGMNDKQLLKLLSPYYEDDLQEDEFDMDLNELIHFQLEMIRYISAHNKKYDHIFCVMKLDHLDQAILHTISEIENCKFIIFTNYYLKNTPIEDFCLFENQMIDFADLEQFYYVFTQQSTSMYTLQEVKSMILNYLTNNYTQKHFDIYHELKNFSI